MTALLSQSHSGFAAGTDNIIPGQLNQHRYRNVLTQRVLMAGEIRCRRLISGRACTGFKWSIEFAQVDAVTGQRLPWVEKE
ncbi:hypothetical protein KCP75_07550 [Salmonella enterica subsp. enterica]|nr:hypothetical protein KCP75_07550 [Salmonella enterica subsp. enterica]